MQVIVRNIQGFHNIGGARKEAASVGCKKPLIVTNGPASQAYKKCMAEAAQRAADVDKQQAQAAIKDAESAPDRARAAEALAAAEAAKTARALSPLAITGIVVAALAVAGGITFLIIRYS